MRYVALGAVIGLAVLLAASLGSARGGAPAGLPEPVRHALHDGRAELRLAPRTSSVIVFDERLWPTEQWAPAARDATESGRWAGAGAGVATDVLPGPVSRTLPVRVAVPPGRYRLRFAGEGYRLARGADRLRIELWPRRADAPPSVRRRWAGWRPTRRGAPRPSPTAG